MKLKELLNVLPGSVYITLTHWNEIHSIKDKIGTILVFSELNHSRALDSFLEEEVQSVQYENIAMGAGGYIIFLKQSNTEGTVQPTGCSRT